MANEYTPTDEDMWDAWEAWAEGMFGPDAEAQFARFLARVRAEAAREALDKLAREVRHLIPKAADPAQADRMKYAAGLLAAEAGNYPKEGQ